jgi:two-component system cell cycle response regulator
VEIDNFGVLGEAYGQAAADRVLCELADRLRARCRPGDLVARIGPHRFGILLPGLDAYEATRFAAILRIMVCDRRISIEPGTALRVTATVGVGSMPAHAVAPRHLMRAVAGALSAGVVAGANRTHTPYGPVNLTSTTRDLGLGSSPGRHRESKIGEGWWAEDS